MEKEKSLLRMKSKNINELGQEDNYEDEDFTIYFNKISLLDHIKELQSGLLFKIGLVQQEEIQLEQVLE